MYVYVNGIYGHGYFVNLTDIESLYMHTYVNKDCKRFECFRLMQLNIAIRSTVIFMNLFRRNK